MVLVVNLHPGHRPRTGAIHDLAHDVRWTGDELSAEVGRRSRVLRRHCSDGADLFVIAHANTASFFADLFAVWEAGGCAVCVNPQLSPLELRTVVEFTEPRGVLIDGDIGTSLAARILRTADETTSATPGEPVSVSLDDPALILFTSGTSGEPKGVVHTHRSLLARLTLNDAHIGASDLTRSLCVLPTHFGHGLIGNCLTPLFAHCDLFLMPEGGIASAAQLGSTIDTHRISFLSSVPEVWKVALRVSSPPTFGTLARIHVGSAPLSSELWQDVIAWSGAREVVNMYGITETANWVAGASSAKFAPEDGLLGTLWGGDAVVRDEDGRVQPEGQGEILLRVPSIMSSYYRRPDLTADVLQRGWYSTGDIGAIDAAGVIRMTGRTRGAINQGGIKIYPEELDLLFERHPEVENACAFGVPDAVSGETVAVAVRLRKNARVSAVELRRWAGEHLRPDAVPRRVFVLDDIPKTDRGKLNRAVVAKRCLDGGIT